MTDLGDYSRDDLLAAIRGVGIGAGDIVSLQVSLGRLGLPRGVPGNYDAISNFVIDAFLDVVGPTGTLIVPTYTYSIGRGEVFDVEATPSAIGDFSEVFRKRRGVCRSRDPMLSSAGIGPHANEVLRNISRSCYGVGSTFHRLRDAGAKICTLGISLYWATFRHHIEEMAGVPFRFRKAFDGVVRENGVTSRETWTYLAAVLNKRCEPVGLPLEKKARAAGLVAVAPLGRGEIMAIGAREYFDFGLVELKRDPWLTAQGPACGLDELVRLEDERARVPAYHVAIETGASMVQMTDLIWRLQRDPVSAGLEATLQALARQVPVTIHRFPSGSQIEARTVPEKWTCHNARLETLDGAVVFSAQDNPLHVASHSHPVDREITRDELSRHLHVHPTIADATPHRDVFGRREWGLCCSNQIRQTLVQDRYRVVIDSVFSYGALHVGEVVVRGASEDCIVLCTQLGHAMQANNGLSGVVVGIDVMRALAARSGLHFTYRLLIAPKALGSLAYLSHYRALVERMLGGIYLDIVGLDQPLMLERSLYPTSPFDRSCLDTLKHVDPTLRTGRIPEIVTDDARQFNAQGYAVPMISLARTSPAADALGDRPYPAYGSDRDRPTAVSETRLLQTRDTVLAIIDVWESQRFSAPRTAAMMS